jgi:hypothetical protein
MQQKSKKGEGREKGGGDCGSLPTGKKAPRTNIQAPEKHQAPIAQAAIRQAGFLAFTFFLAPYLAPLPVWRGEEVWTRLTTAGCIGAGGRSVNRLKEIYS